MDNLYKSFLEEYVLNLKEISKILPVEFVPLNEISDEGVDINTTDPFIINGGIDRLKESLLNYGTYWALVLAKNLKHEDEFKEYYIVRQGHHRIYAYKKLIEEGKLSKDSSVLCIKCEKYNVSDSITEANHDIKGKEPLIKFNISVWMKIMEKELPQYYHTVLRYNKKFPHWFFKKREDWFVNIYNKSDAVRRMDWMVHRFSLIVGRKQYAVGEDYIKPLKETNIKGRMFK